MARKKHKKLRITCDYCGDPAVLKSATELYGLATVNRLGLHGRMFWVCDPCGAWVGCHRNSSRHIPLGRLANADLRLAKMEAHRYFDPLWKAVAKRDRVRNCEARDRAYAWLSVELGLPERETHIGLFDQPTCWEVVRICKRYYGGAETEDS